MSKANDSDRYVVPNKERGGWDVKKEHAKRASAHTGIKKDAVDRARQIVKNEGGGEIRIQNQKGKLIDSDTVRGPKHSESKARDRK
jgi:pimeloyl-CoA synthetase